MADAKTEDINFYTPEVVDLMIEYKTGWANKQNTVRDMMKLTGLDAPVCEALLDLAKTQTAVELRGYSKEPEELARVRHLKKRRGP